MRGVRCETRCFFFRKTFECVSSSAPSDTAARAHARTHTPPAAAPARLPPAAAAGPARAAPQTPPRRHCGTSHELRVTCTSHMSHVTRHTSHVMRHASRVKRQSPLRGSADGHRLLHRQTTGFVYRALHLRSPAIRNNERHKPHAIMCVTCHTSYVTCHTTHVTCRGGAGPRLRRGGARAKGKRSCNTRGGRFKREQNRGAKGRCKQGTQEMQGGTQLRLQNRLQQTPKQRTAGTSAAPLVCAGAEAVACHTLVACHISHKHVTCQSHTCVTTQQQQQQQQ